MFPVARILDPITHDLLTPCGVIALPPGVVPHKPVIVEGQPIAFAGCQAVCTGAVSTGIVHPPIPPPLPQPVLAVLLNPTVVAYAMPVARWVLSGDASACGAFLGDPKLAATRTVLMGGPSAGALGVFGAALGASLAGLMLHPPTLKLQVVIIEGSSWDSDAGRERILAELGRFEEITGIRVEVVDVSTVKDSDLLHVDSRDKAIRALDEHGSGDQPTMFFTDDMSDPAYGKIHGGHYPRNDGGNEGVFIGEGGPSHVPAHELGHLLAGPVSGDGVAEDGMHASDPDNVMAEGGGNGNAEWTDPWKSQSEKNPYVD